MKTYMRTTPIDKRACCKPWKPSAWGMVILLASMVAAGAQESFKADARTLALWKMTYQPNSTEVRDLSSGGYDLIPAKKDSPPREVSGNRGKALAFGQDTSSLKLAGLQPAALLGDKGVTIQAWVRPQHSERELSMIVECFDYLKGGWRLGFEKSGGLAFTLESTTGEIGISGKAPFFDGEWHLVEASYDKASGQTLLKVDGKEIAQKTLQPDGSQLNAKNLQFQIGSGSADALGWYYAGEIESLKISEGAILP